MGTLEWKTMNTRVPLRKRCMLGRGATSDVRVDSPKVSAEHASLHWLDGSWELRDLGSRNGTFLGGRRLAAGERALLEVGATFSLSRSAAVFELIDASPPSAAAQHRESGTWHVASGGLLALPSADRPEVIVFSASDGTWYIEMEQQTRPAVDAEVITIGGDSFSLEVPAPGNATLLSGTLLPPLESIRLRFEVTPDEEEVDLIAFVEGKPHKIPPRRYHYLLVTLARAWLAEEGVAPSVRGWVDREELCKKLAMDVTKLNVEIYRARKQFAALSVQGAAGLVERRPGTHEIRIGVSHVEVVRL